MTEALSVCLFVRYQTRERDTLNKNEPISMQISSSDPRQRGMKRSISGVRGSKVTGGQS